jgi:hypothetical protein
VQADLIARLEALGRAGLLVSVCFGFTPVGVLRWSVDVMRAESGEGFDQAFAARDFGHCLEIAEAQARSRGWLPPVYAN